MLDVIKEYLVSLGFEVDNKSFSQANKAIDSVGKATTDMAGETIGSFLKAGAAVTDFVARATIGIAKFVSGLGQAQIENEIFARRMWTTQNSAMALNNTLGAMGVSLQDLYLSPTLMEQFKQLRNEANQLQMPSDYKNEMSQVQAVTFEFTRMKLEATYALQWIGYYFVKYMSGPLGTVKNALDKINDAIVKNLPKWSKVIAVGLVDVVKLGQTIFWALSSVGKFVATLSSTIPNSIKVVAAALMLLSSPIGIIIAGLLLLQDYLTFEKGGKSALPQMWTDLDKFINRFKNSEAIAQFKSDFTGALNSIGKLIDNVKQKLEEFFNECGKTGTLDALVNTAASLGGAVASVVKGLTDLGNYLLKIKGIKDDIINPIVDGINAFLDGLRGVFDIVNALGKLLSGDSKGAWKEFMKALTPETKDNTKKIVPSNRNSSDTGALFGPQAYLYGQGNSYSYMYPQTSTTNHVNNTLNQTNHIYGSNSGNTVEAIQTSAKSIVRNFQGVII